MYGPAVHKGEVAVNVQVRQLVLGHLPLDPRDRLKHSVSIVIYRARAKIYT